MERHLQLVHSAPELADVVSLREHAAQKNPVQETNVVDLHEERRKRLYRYHPSAGRAWLDGLFDDDLDPVC